MISFDMNFTIYLFRKLFCNTDSNPINEDKLNKIQNIINFFYLNISFLTNMYKFII